MNVQFPRNPSFARFLIASLFTCLLVGPQAFAQQTPPEGGTPKDFSLPNKTSFSLDNGITVTLVPYGALPKVTVSAAVYVGNINEAENQVQLADVMGDLLKEGTTSRSAEQIANEAAGMGGAVNIGVGLDQMTVSGSVLTEYGPSLVELIADILMNPAFPDSEIDRLKRDRLRQQKIQLSRPGTLALVKFRELLHGDHPYGRIFPTEEMLLSYTVDDVRSFYSANVGGERTRIYVAGKFDAKAMEQAIRSAFNSWQGGSERQILIPDVKPVRELALVDIPGAAQSNLLMGLPVADPSSPDYVALKVMDSILGGSFASRITSNIREDKGYTYSPFSSVSSRYRDAYWSESAAVTTSVTGASLKEIFYEIELLQNEPPSEEELTGIKNYMAGTFVLQNSTPAGIVAQLNFLELHGLSDDYLTSYVRRVYAVTPEEVQRIAKEYIRSGDLLTVIAGDVNVISSQVEPYRPMAN